MVAVMQTVDETRSARAFGAPTAPRNRHGDISADMQYNGDLPEALEVIVLLLPGRTDMYFPPDDDDRTSAGRWLEVREIPAHWVGSTAFREKWDP